MAFPFRSRRHRPAERLPYQDPQPGPFPWLQAPPPESAPAAPDGVVGVGDEVEAFLQGRLVDYLVAKHRSVPAWAALNEVAHATADQLATLAALAALAGQPGEDAAPGAGEARWRLDQRTLAAKLLEGARTPDEVAEIQRKVLVPLELWLIERSRTATVTSRQGLEMATEVLDDLRADR